MVWNSFPLTFWKYYYIVFLCLVLLFRSSGVSLISFPVYVTGSSSLEDFEIFSLSFSLYNVSGYSSFFVLFDAWAVLSFNKYLFVGSLLCASMYSRHFNVRSSSFLNLGKLLVIFSNIVFSIFFFFFLISSTSSSSSLIHSLAYSFYYLSILWSSLFQPLCSHTLYFFLVLFSSAAYCQFSLMSLRILNAF